MRFDVLVVWSSVFVLLFGIAYARPTVETVTKPLTETAQLLALTGYFSESVDIDELAQLYTERVRDVVHIGSALAAPEHIKVLIVPGHDDTNVGAQFNGLREVDLNRLLAQRIEYELIQNGAFDVLVASTEKGWHPVLASFFANNHEGIDAFASLHKEATKKLEPVLHVYENKDVVHNEAIEEVVTSLYGINKFVNDNAFDIVLHVHFNDYPGRKPKQAGKYEGFAVYMPSVQLSNGRASQRLARHVVRELASVQSVSNLPIESVGIIEDSELISVGAYNTVRAAALLIEYGFIYEEQFSTPDLRADAFDALAKATVRALTTALSSQY